MNRFVRSKVDLELISIVSQVCSFESRDSIDTSLVEATSTWKGRKKRHSALERKARAARFAMQAVGSSRMSDVSLESMSLPDHRADRALAVVAAARRDGSRLTMANKETVTADFTGIVIECQDLISLSEALLDVPFLGKVVLTGLTTPRTLAPKVFSLLLNLVTENRNIVELILSESCELLPKHEEMLSKALQNNLQAIVARHERREERIRKKLERQSRMINPDMMDFFHWENSNRLAIYELRERDWKNLLAQAEKSKAKVIALLLKQQNYKFRHAQRVAIGEEESTARTALLYDYWKWTLAMHIHKFFQWENALRLEVVREMRAELEGFQIEKVDDMIQAKERLKGRLHLQRQQRLQLMNDQKRQLMLIQSQDLAWRCAVYMWHNEKGKKWDRSWTKKKEQEQREQEEKEREILKKKMVEEHEKKQKELANERNQKELQKKICVLLEKETEARDLLEEQQEIVLMRIGQSIGLLNDVAKNYNDFHKKLREVQQGIAKNRPELIVSLPPTTPCHYEHGPPSTILRGLCVDVLETSSQSLKHFLEDVTIGELLPQVRKFNGSVDVYKSVLEKVSDDEGQPISISQLKEPTPVAELLKRAFEANAGTEIVLYCNTSEEYGDFLDCPSSILPELFACSTSNGKLIIKTTKAMPISELSGIESFVKFDTTSTNRDARFLTIHIQFFISSSIISPFMEEIATDVLKALAKKVIVVGPQSLQGEDANCTCSEYTHPTACPLFRNVVLGDPLLSMGESVSVSTFAPYHVLEIEFLEGYNVKDLICIDKTQGIEIGGFGDALIADGEVIGNVETGTLWSPEDARQSRLDELIYDAPLIRILFSSGTSTENVQLLIQSLCFANKDPACIIGDRKIAIRLTDYTSSIQRLKSTVHVVAESAKNILMLDRTKISCATLQPKIVFDSDALNPYVFLFEGAKFTNYDTCHFKGGFVDVDCKVGDRDCDVVALATSSVPQPYEALRLTKEGDVNRSRVTINLDTFDVSFEGTTIGKIIDGSIVKPVNGPFPENSVVHVGSKTFGITVELDREGACSIPAVQALIRSFVFFTTSTDYDTPRSVDVTIAVGPSLGKCSQEGIVVIPYSPAAPNPEDVTPCCNDTVSVTVLPTLLSTKISSLSYKARQSTVRLPATEVSMKAPETWEKAVIIVEMFPPLQGDLFSITSHEFELKAATSDSPGTTFLAPSGSFVEGQGFIRTNSKQRRSVVNSRQPSPIPIAVHQSPGAVDFDTPLQTVKVDDSGVQSETDDEEEGVLLSSASWRATPISSPATLQAGGSFSRRRSLGSPEEMARLAISRRIIEGINNEFRKFEGKDKAAAISRGFDDRITFDSKGTAKMALALKDRIVGGINFDSSGRTVISFGPISRRDIGSVLKSLTFANFSEHLNSSTRSLRVVLTDGCFGFSEVGFRLETAAYDVSPSLSLLLNKTGLRIGGSYIGDPVGAFCIAPLGRAALSHSEMMLPETTVTISIQSSPSEKDSLAILTPDQQHLQHSRSQVELNRLGSKTARVLRADVPENYTIHLEQVSEGSGQSKIFAVDFQQSYIAEVIAERNVIKIVTCEKEVPISSLSYLINCIALEPGQEFGVRTIHFDIETQNYKPAKTEVLEVDVLPNLAKPAANPEMITVKFEEGKSTVVVPFANQVVVESGIPHIKLITVALEEAGKNDGLGFAHGLQMRVKRGELMVRGKMCGRISVSKKLLRIEPTVDFTGSLIQELLDGLAFTFQHSQFEKVEAPKIVVTLHDDVDLPTVVTIPVKWC